MTDYKSMFEQAVRALAAIDEALGIGDDGCGDPDQTLTAIAELKAGKAGPQWAITTKGNKMEFGVLYMPSGWQRECADEAQARDVFEHAPQSDGDCAILILNGEESLTRNPD